MCAGNFWLGMMLCRYAAVKWNSWLGHFAMCAGNLDQV